MNIQLPIRNFKAQQTIFDCPARYVIVPKGRRFGLTRGAANNFIKSALAGKFKQGLWVDVINSNIEKYIQRYFMPALTKLPKELWKWDKDPHVIHLKGSYIDFRSAEHPESIEGFGYDYGFLNEAGIILKNEYLWNNAIRPMLWDTKCRLVIGGTPKGKGEFFRLYNRGLDINQTDYKSFKFTSFDNPYIQHEQIMEDIKTMPERVVKQEIYAEFLDDTGVVFQGVVKVAILAPQEPLGSHIYVIGCDLAKVQDFTVLTVYDRTNNNQVYQMRFNQLEYPFQRKKIKDLSDKYNHALVILDSTGVGEPTFDDLSREGVPVEPHRFTNEFKKNIIEKLSNWIELGHLKMLQLEDTINEFNSFTYDYSEKTGRVLYGAPVGFHDDIVCFTKGTSVLTNKGHKSIEDIKIGDIVLTRKGFKPVINTISRIKEVITNNTLGLTGTPDHPIFTKSGIKPLAKLCDTDIIYMWNEKLSSIEEKAITDIQNQRGDNSEFTSGDMTNGKNRHLHFTDKFGLITSVQFLKDTLSTIKTKTQLIMKLVTFVLWRKENTTDNTCYLQKTEKDQARTGRNKYLSYWTVGESGDKKIQRLHITSHKRGDSYSVEMEHSKDGATKRQRVYNLTVADVPEYFANNILVHNCSHALAIWALQPIAESKKVAEMTVIQKDLYEKTKDFKDQQEDSFDPLDYEEV